MADLVTVRSSRMPSTASLLNAMLDHDPFMVDVPAELIDAPNDYDEDSSDYDEDYGEDYGEDYDEDYDNDGHDNDGHDCNDDAENDVATDPQDLRSSKTFPVYRDCPFEHAVDAYRTASWCFIGQVIDDLSLGRPVLLVQDKSGAKIRVAFYFDNNVQFNYKDIRIGFVIAVLYAARHFFLDGTVGLRPEEPEYVKVSCK